MQGGLSASKEQRIAAKRVAQLLLDLSLQSSGRLSIDLSLSRTEAADYLGITVELFCRILSLFAEYGVIRIPDTQQIEIVDVHILEVIASGDLRKEGLLAAQSRIKCRQSASCKPRAPRYVFDFKSRQGAVFAVHEIVYKDDDLAIAGAHSINGFPTIGASFEVWRDDQLIHVHHNCR